MLALKTICYKLTYQKILVHTQSKIGIIYLDSKSDHNCLSRTLRAELVYALLQHSRNPIIKTIVLMSKLEKTFCAGGNLKDFYGSLSKDYICNDFLIELQQTILNIQKPIVCAVNGAAFGGGTELALMADVVVCSDKAIFCLPEIKLGLIPGFGGTQHLSRIAGRIVANKNILNSDIIDAKKAESMGIVSQVYIHEQLQTKTLQLAGRISEKALSVLISAKNAIKKADEGSLSQGIRYERKLFYQMFDEKAAQQGVKAFLQKRNPDFSAI